MKMLSISIIIPTYNSAKTLQACLESICKQDYAEDKIEIIIADAGSSDNTVEIARQFTDKIYSNPLKTGEAGKAVGVMHATGEIIALIDSDNILSGQDWLTRMTAPFEDMEIAGSEPLYYTHRQEDGFITRYCALLGMNDPLCMFTGNYDRMNIITGKWTEMPVVEKDEGDFLKIRLDSQKLPTIGANGFLIRKNLLDKCTIDDYLFDIDVVYELALQGYCIFAKVKIGIVHIFSGNLATFIRKQKRRIKDYGFHNKNGTRKYPWAKLPKAGILKFILFSMFVFPLIFQSFKGFMKKRDTALFFHVIACWSTLIVYGIGTIQNLIHVKEADRAGWNIK